MKGGSISQNLLKIRIAFLSCFDAENGNKHMIACLNKNIRKYITLLLDDKPFRKYCHFNFCFNFIERERWIEHDWWVCSQDCKGKFYGGNCAKCYSLNPMIAQNHPIMQNIYDKGDGALCSKCCPPCRICKLNIVKKPVLGVNIQDGKILDVAWVCSKMCQDKYNVWWIFIGEKEVAKSPYGCAHWNNI